jgi:arsenite methyltransferase
VAKTTPNYGVDAPGVLYGLLLSGAACLVAAIFINGVLHFHIGSTDINFRAGSSLYWTGGCLLLEGLLFLSYVKFGKFSHRNRILAYHSWRGDEQILDVGCGRGLLLVGAAKRLNDGEGHVIGIDIWSNKDMGGNSLAATQKNIDLEGVTSRCELLSMAAQSMNFADESFDVIVSNLCLHNIYDKPVRKQAVQQIARVLKRGGQAMISDYKLTGEYARILTDAGCVVTLHWGSPLTTFPPLRTVIARKQ